MNLLFVFVLLAIVCGAVNAKVLPKAVVTKKHESSKKLMELRGGATSLGPIDKQAFVKISALALAAFGLNMGVTPKWAAELFRGEKAPSESLLQIVQVYGMVLCYMAYTTYTLATKHSFTIHTLTEFNTLLFGAFVAWFAKTYQRGQLYSGGLVKGQLSGVATTVVLTLIGLYLLYA